MLRALSVIRPAERRDTWAAFFTLFGFIASHSLLETARDALFLAKVPASRLAWMYLAIAGVSLLTNQVAARFAANLVGRAALTTWTALSGAVTLAFAVLLPSMGAAGLYALYLWSGVLTSLVLVHFWTLLANLFTVTQAKRVYGLIGAGSVLGAIVGSASATGLARILQPVSLVYVAAGGLFVSSALPYLFREAGNQPAMSGTASAPSSLRADAEYVARQPYARRVAWMLIASSACFTFADYVFKSSIASRGYAPKDLASVLGLVSLVLNGLSLLSQLALVQWLIRRFDLSRAIAVTPALLLVFGLGAVVTSHIAAPLLVRAADGTLRHSLHRTTSELLFVPLGDEARRRVKAFIDVVGQRGGQALASVALLALVALDAPRPLFAACMCVLAAVWLIGARGLHRHYLDLFRDRLREGRLAQVGEFSELDVASLETLVAALDSVNDGEVLAALDVLEREGKPRFVPALILYHPSEAVVARALAFFTRIRRKNVVQVVERLLAEHPSARVRAAAVAALSMLAPDPRLWKERLVLEESPAVRATIAVHLMASGELASAPAMDQLEELLASGSAETRVAIAEAISLRQPEGFDAVLATLARAAEVEVRRAAAHAIAQVRVTALVPLLVELLGDEQTRAVARAALLELQDDGFDALAHALEDEQLPRTLRNEIPRALGLFDPQRAAPLILRRFTHEPDGMVRYRLLRVLEGLVARAPAVELDQSQLRLAIESTVRRAYLHLAQRRVLEGGAIEDAARATPGHAFLARMLHDKEKHAIGRLFRLLGLTFPTEDFAEIHRGLSSERSAARASSLELIENLLDEPLRSAVVGLVDDVSDADRLAAAGTFHQPLAGGYETLLRELLASGSAALRDVTVFHVGELTLSSLFEPVQALTMPGDPRSDAELTLRILGAQTGEVAC